MCYFPQPVPLRTENLIKLPRVASTGCLATTTYKSFIRLHDNYFSSDYTHRKYGKNHYFCLIFLEKE